MSDYLNNLSKSVYIARYLFFFDILKDSYEMKELKFLYFNINNNIFKREK